MGRVSGRVREMAASSKVLEQRANAAMPHIRFNFTCIEAHNDGSRDEEQFDFKSLLLYLRS